MGKAFGYARVSTEDQDTAIQRTALLGAGVLQGLLFEERRSGAQRDGRKELERVLSLLSRGDSWWLLVLIALAGHSEISPTSRMRLKRRAPI